MTIDVEVPKRLRKRPKDHRGYPVPYLVVIRNGKPVFSVNDGRKVHQAIRKGLCGLCGEPLHVKRGNLAWFIAAPSCFLEPLGAFIDPPSHEECARYAIQVCPYLAAPSYGKMVAASQHVANAVGQTPIVHPASMEGGRPPLFGLGATATYSPIGEINNVVFVNLTHQWSALEFWKHGNQLTDPDQIRREIQLNAEQYERELNQRKPRP